VNLKYHSTTAVGTNKAEAIRACFLVLGFTTSAMMYAVVKSTSAVANVIHEVRSVMFEALKRIDHAGNTEEFQGLLTEKIQPDAADNLLEAIRQTEKRYGVAAARRQIRTAISVAKQRKRALRVFEATRK